MDVFHYDADEMIRILDDDGQVVDEATVPELSDETFVEMYRQMRLARHFDQRAVSLQRQGRMGTYPPLSGQEGAQVGSAHALDDTDRMFPSYREHIASYVQGLSLQQTLLTWMGHPEGNAIPDELNLFPVTVPIATQIPHAVGAAWASKLRDETRAFLVYLGDGATSEGDFHVGMNFAGVFDTPTVFFCNNNQWAISMPRERQTASETIAQKAVAYGFEGVQVDGMDPLAVYQVTKQALVKAKDPDTEQRRPTLIEAVQYRFGAHTTSDDPSVYREEDEEERWKQKDPIPRFETFLKERGVLTDEQIDTIEESIENEVAEAIDTAESVERPEPSGIVEHTYESVPSHLTDQLAALEDIREQYGDERILQD